MGLIQQILLPQNLDLDSLASAWLLGVNAKDQVRFIAGSASGAELTDHTKIKIEVGGSGQMDNNCFDHHPGVGQVGGISLSAAAQILRRKARIIDYVDAIDRGHFKRLAKVGFPSLVQLVSGMLLTVEDSWERVQNGNVLFNAVLRSGINPFKQNMENILDDVPGARAWAEAKRAHEARFQEVLDITTWSFTTAGRKMAEVETEWFGAPGALYGAGAVVIVALNPAMKAGGRTIRKLTVASHSSQKEKNISVRHLLPLLNAMEVERGGRGDWGGPEHGTIIGSAKDCDTMLQLAEVAEVVRKML